MLTFLMIAFIAFFVISGFFLTVEARRRNQRIGAPANGRNAVAKSAQISESNSDSDVRRAA